MASGTAAAAKTKPGQVVLFVQEKTTKGTVRYREEVEGDKSPFIDMLYVKKATFSKLNEPENLSVTVKPAGAKPTTAKNGQVVATFAHASEKDTSKSRRYHEAADEPAVGVLYLKNHFFDKLGQPEKVELLLESDDE